MPDEPKPIRYTDHLLHRLELRGISRDLPIEILENPGQMFFDVATQYQIAIAYVFHQGKWRPMMVAFEESRSEIVLVTVHPLDEKDIEAKIKSGRWQP